MDCDVFRLSGNPLIFDAFVKAEDVINGRGYDKIMCSVSGGSDSDLMIDLLTKIDRDKKVTYVFFDTGLEYDATKRHLEYLEDTYQIEIHRFRPRKPIPASCKEYGQPFLSKSVSQQLQALQNNGFRFEDDPLDVLLERYDRCKAGLKWWSNAYPDTNGHPSFFNIRRNKHLKEFMIENPPWFRISNKCCKYAKKLVATDAIKEFGAALNIVGVRKAEGGIRAARYYGCYKINDNMADEYRPIFWWTDREKRDYESAYGIRHSDCYEVYGLRRTGCAGCPFGRRYSDELDIIDRYEPRLSKAVKSIFGDAYEYTRMYREYCTNRGE